MLKKLSQNRIFRFLICGVITAAFNVLLLELIIKGLKLEQPITRNIANVVAIEVSLIFSFFVYRTWVWSAGKWNLQKIFRREIPLYHLSCGSIVAIRSLVLFPALDWFGVSSLINTLVGIAVGSVMNYVMGERLVFKEK